MSFGEDLKRMRDNKSLTLTELGELASCSNPYLSQIENSMKLPSMKMLFKLSRVLNFDAKDYFYIYDDDNDLPNGSGQGCSLGMVSDDELIEELRKRGQVKEGLILGE